MKHTIAVIGCGRIANAAHLPALSRIPDVRIKYGCDIILSKAEAAKAAFPNIEQAVEDYHTVLADPEVETVFVLTPNAVHYTVTMDALRAGKHVFCEKPIAVRYALAEEMEKEAKAQGKLLNIGVCNRYQKSVEMLADMNRKGEFGHIYHVCCSFRSRRSIPGLGGAFTTKAESGGGVLIDWGIHFFDLILYILGESRVTEVMCDTYSELAKDMKSYRYESMWAEDTGDVEHGTNDVEELASGYIRTPSAGISFTGAWAQNIPKEEMYIDFLGDKKGARLDYCGHFTLFDGETLKTETPEYDIPNMYEVEDRAFLVATETGEKTRSYIDNILPSAKLLEDLYASAAQHKHN